MKQTFSLIALMAAFPAFAEDSRQLDAHVHGIGEMNMAVEGETVLIELHAPGADIVGFEYAAESDTDLAAIDNALLVLDAPLELFTFPEAAGCAVTSASAEMEGEAEHDDHDDDHGEDEHDEHEHDDHGEDHAGEASHTEFHAEYVLTCADPSAITRIDFPYFDTFPNALELEVKIVTPAGAQAFEVERVAPTLDLPALN